MKIKGNIKKKIAIIIILAIFIVFLYSLNVIVRTGKQAISVKTVTNFYAGDTLEATVAVKNKKTGDALKSNITVELLDSDDKKVKNVKEKYKLSEGEEANIAIDLPDDLESGKYNLKVTSKSGMKKDVTEVPITITDQKESEVIISLDKGIYKPGDEVNYRALFISKKDNTPLALDSVDISIYDGNDNRVYCETFTTSDYGIVSGSFDIADTVNSGTYKLVASNQAKEVTKEFIVNPYVTPKFEVAVSTDKDTYIVGEKANVTIGAKYFFGEPVTNATIQGTINDEEFSGLTNESGTFTKEVEISDDGKYEVNLNVQDSSNYYVEASKTFYAATDIFEVEILPEYDNIISGIDNNIYFITKNADGTPVKTYMNVKIGKIKRDVVTDENGIGKLTLTSDDIESFEKGSQAITINAEDMSGQTVKASEYVSVITKSGTILTTDKVKYNENENISVSVSSMTDNTSNQIYVFKGNELVKTVSFDGDNVEFNLDGIYGLVDICVNSAVSGTTESYSSDYYFKSTTGSSSQLRYNHRTIFIKPSDSLNIEINTDKEIYEPKDTLNASFSVSNQNNESTDAALLVSILDNAVLSLADNDLSIDNLKIALGDIEISGEGITAADLYAMVLDDSNETALNSILLKQNLNSSTKIKTVINTSVDMTKYQVALVVSTILLILIVIKALCKKFPKFAKLLGQVFVALINIFAIFVVLEVCFGELIQDVLIELESSDILEIAVCVVLSIVAYTLILYKQEKYMFTLICELGIVPFIIGGIIYFVWVLVDSENFAIISILFLAIAYCILVVLERRKKLNNFWTGIKNIMTIFLKAVLFWVATAIICDFLNTQIGFLVVLACYVIFEKFVLKKTDIKMKNKKIVVNITGNELIGVYAGIIFIIIVVVFLKTVGERRVVYDSVSSSSTYDWSSDINSAADSSSDILFSNIETSTITKGAADSTEAAKSSGFSFETSLFSSSTLDDSSTSENAIVEEDEIDVTTEKEQEVEENIRNVFLESLAFVPELVTSDGKSELNLTISDNITTWNMQVVGNTKDGTVGYSSKEFKVFKEFFVDFSLPTNTVETDNVSIPVTVYNYTENALTVSLNVVENDWSKIGDYTKEISVPAGSTQNVYVPLEIIKAGDNTLRIESKSGDVSDIVEKQMTVSVNGVEKEEVVSSGSFEKTLEQDIVYKEDAIEGTKTLKVKLYPTAISQTVENMDSILKMPSGCFEQTSSSLYPDVLVLKYLKDNNMSNSEIEEKALEYISKGYQKLLTYEVYGTKGGYSLYGNDPAEPVITALGLMEMNDMQEVYSVDENVISNMIEYLFDEQNFDGSFDYDSTYIGGASSTNDVAMNAYITWALSEVCPEDSRLEKSVEYLENKLDDELDSYTLALMANVFSNTNSDKTKKTIERLMDKVIENDNDSVYIKSNSRGYLGCYGTYQDIQATALTSLVLTKENSNEKTNTKLINYIISKKDNNGSWHNTQSTILALKAINEYNSDSLDISNQTITVSVNGESKDIEVGENQLDVYELEFTNLDVENNISISMKKGKIYYEIVKEYYETYSQADTASQSSGKIDISQTITQEANVNDVVVQKISLTNLSGEKISNGIVRINIPQGCSVLEDSLLQLEYDKKIEKFEYNYSTIDLYLRNYTNNSKLDLTVQYRAQYPETITGASIKAYDYYNPDIEGFCMPVQITIKGN